MTVCAFLTAPSKPAGGDDVAVPTGHGEIRRRQAAEQGKHPFTPVGLVPGDESDSPRRYLALCVVIGKTGAGTDDCHGYRGWAWRNNRHAVATTGSGSAKT
jgi:hypothetical protein